MTTPDPAAGLVIVSARAVRQAWDALPSMAGPAAEIRALAAAMERLGACLDALDGEDTAPGGPETPPMFDVAAGVDPYAMPPNRIGPAGPVPGGRAG